MISTPIASGGKIIRDDKPPHIDAYGLESIISIRYQLERCIEGEDDPKRVADMRQIQDSIGHFIRRYEPT